MLESAEETLDVVNPYVTDRGMIRRIEQAARRGVRVRLFVPANANNWACAAAQQFHHAALLDAGVRILEYPTMLHAKAFVRDGEELLAGTCNLEAWSLKRFLEIDIQIRSTARAAQFDERFSAPAEAVSSPGRRLTGTKERAKADGVRGCSRRCSDAPRSPVWAVRGWGAARGSPRCPAREHGHRRRATDSIDRGRRRDRVRRRPRSGLRRRSRCSCAPCRSPREVPRYRVAERPPRPPRRGDGRGARAARRRWPTASSPGSRRSTASTRCSCPTLAYVLLGSSRRLVIGPEGSVSTLVAAAVLPLAVAGSDERGRARVDARAARRRLLPARARCCGSAGSPTTSRGRC